MSDVTPSAIVDADRYTGTEKAHRIIRVRRTTEQREAFTANIDTMANIYTPKHD